MQPLAIDLQDRAVSFARGGEILSSAPSAVWDGSAGEPAGTNAWQALRLHPMATSTHHFGALLSQAAASDRSVALVAAELVRRLAEQPPKPGESVWMGTPANASEPGLSAMLAIARKLSLPLDGFVDSAVAVVAALGLEGRAIVLEIGLHHAAATSVDRDGAQVRRRRAVVTERGGLMAFYQAWLELVSTTMVKQTRFDPLHDAATEQRLFDSLAGWARAAATEGSARVALTKGTEAFEIALTRDQFAQAGRPRHREVARLLHELRPAGAPITLVAPSIVNDLPGLKNELEQFVGCELVSLPDGFAAAAISRLDLPERTPNDPVRLLRRLPAQDPTTQDPKTQDPKTQGPKTQDFKTQDPTTTVHGVTRSLLGGDGDGAGHRNPPSHLLLEDQVYALTSEPLVLGRSPAGARTLPLPEGIAGVSRRHCTLTQEGGEVVLLDHSSFGTFVNGERVVERVRVRAGDRVRLGDPGVELALISINAAPDPTNHTSHTNQTNRPIRASQQ